MQVEGRVEKVRYHSKESGFTVFVLETADGPLPCVGSFLSLQPGEQYALTGEFTFHPKFGEQFQVHQAEKQEPSTEGQLVAYLSSGLFPHLGQARAQALVKRYGLKVLETIYEHPEVLLKIRGIGRKRAKEIHQALAEQKASRAVMLYLQSLDLTIHLAGKIVERYGAKTRQLLEENPYRLAEDIEGVGFHTADQIARRLGVAEDSYFRTLAGLTYLFSNRMVEEGSCFWSYHRVEEELQRLLGQPSAYLDQALEALVTQGRLYRQGGPVQDPSDRWYPAWAFEAERSVAYHLARLLAHGSDLPLLVIDAAAVEQAMALSLSDLQKKAIRETAHHSVMVITGGPGTGKTTILRAILELFRANGLRSALAAPTGRAAKRMEESTHFQAATLHRLLGFQGQEGALACTYNEDNPLELDALLVDEASMIDLTLMDHLLRALPDCCRLVLVGDVDQLPSVGPGNVLADLIASRRLSTIQLDTIYRQSASSLIVSNAHRIQAGRLPEMNQRAGDFFFLSAPTDYDSADLLEDLVARRLPQAYQLDPQRDIQVLSAMKKGPCGVEELNRRLQQVLNPPKQDQEEALFRGQVFRPGDKIMQIKNNYQRRWMGPDGIGGEGVYNGDFGFIDRLESDGEALVVDLDGRKVRYEAKDFSELAHAFAITIHKAQGSEFPCVVLPIIAGSPFFLTRNLLYTAITRAARLCILLGNPAALSKMVQNDRKDRRNSSLKEALVRAIDLQAGWKEETS